VRERSGTCGLRWVATVRAMHRTRDDVLVSGGISEALVTTALGLFVAIPAVMMFNYFTTKVKAFDVEMVNSPSEQVDYFLKKNITGRR
jgi:biopolymer transport protein ExbB/TolQ